MKKNFFKKLSFVLALAMIISVVAPAAGAFAASKIKLNATSKTLHLGVDGKDEYNFNISSKKGTGWKYAWESTNENVVVVNKKNGVVTATGVGTAKVTVFVTDKDGNEVGDATATVTVRDNIKELTITNKPAGDKLAVGAANDFNRSFKTVSGSTKVTSAITRWTVEPADGASIDDKGVFTATKAGEYTITARAFQSKAKYQDWQKDPVANAAYLLADDTYKVTVAASMTGAKQVNLSKVNVTFNAPMEDVDKNIAVYQLVGETKVKQLIKEVKMDDAKKVATVSLYLDFVTGATYVIEYPGMESVSFKAATTNPEDVASMKIVTESVVYTDADGEEVKVKLYNADGVEITTPALLNRVTMKSSGEAGTWFNEGTKVLIIWEKGKSATITATYHTYKFDNNGNELGNVEAVAVITGVEAVPTNITGLTAWTIVDNNNPDFDKVEQVLSVSDDGRRLFVKLSNKTGNDTGHVNSKDNAGDFEFTSSDESILIVDNAGNLYPVKEGTVSVVVKYATTGTKVPVAHVTINVSGKRVAASVSLSTYDFNLSNTPNLGGTGDYKDVELTLKDQLGNAVSGKAVSVERLGAPVLSGGTVTTDQLTATGDNVATTGSNGKATIRFNADSKTKGTYTYKITAEKLSRVVTITVLEANKDSSGNIITTPAYYRLEVDTTKDLKVDSDTSSNVVVGIKLFGYSQNGVKVQDIDYANTASYKVKVTAPTDNNNPDGQKFETINNLTTSGYEVVRLNGTVSGVTGSFVRKAPLGTYKVEAFEVTASGDVPLHTVYFTLTDSQPVATLASIKSQTYSVTLDPAQISNPNYALLITAVAGADDNNGLKFKVNGASVPVVAVEATGTATSIGVKTVTVRQLIKGTDGTSSALYLDHTVNVGLPFTKK